MRTSLIIAALAAFFLFGCKDNPVESYGTGLVGAKKQAENTKDQANLVGLQQAVQQFRAFNGRLPESLEELKGSVRMEFDVSRYDYDPDTGKVTLIQ